MGSHCTCSSREYDARTGDVVHFDECSTGEVVPTPTSSVGHNERSCFGCVHGSEDGTYCWLVREHLLWDVAKECETWEPEDE